MSPETALGALPAEQVLKFVEISPSQRIDQIKARVFMMHDKHDPYVPVSEADRLAATLPATAQAVLAQFDLFNHVRPNRLLDWFTMFRESLRVVMYLTRLFATIGSGS